MGRIDVEAVHDRPDIVPRAVLRVHRRILWHVRRQETARRIGDAAVASGKVPDLRLPAPPVACELVDKHDRQTFARLFVVEFDAIIGGDPWHRLCLPSFSQLHPGLAAFRGPRRSQ